MVLGNIGDGAGVDAVLHLLRIVEDARGEIFRQCTGIPDFLVGEGTRPIVAVGGLHIEVVPQRLGVGETCPDALAVGGASDFLVHGFRSERIAPVVIIRGT